MNLDLIKSKIADKFKVSLKDIKSFNKIGMGEMNVNYTFSVSNIKFLCRIAMNRNKSNFIEEYKILESIKELDVAPKPILLNHKPLFMVLEYVDGKVFKKKSWSNKELALIANILAKVNMKKPNIRKEKQAYRDCFNWSKKNANEMKKVGGDTVELDKLSRNVEKFVKEEKHPWGLVHTDVFLPNIVWNKNKVYFIDWEGAYLSDPAQDVACFIVNCNFSKKKEDYFIKEYLKIKPDKTLKRRVKIFSILHRFNYLTFAMMRICQIKKKTLSKEFMKNKPIKNYEKEVKHQRKKLMELLK